MDLTELLQDIAGKHGFFDQFCAAWSADYARSGGRLHCGRGCSGCCSLTVNCTAPEALAIARSLTPEQAARVRALLPVIRDCAEQAANLKEWLTLYRREVGPCPLLETDGGCGIYRLRPLSCRSLLSTREPAWCVTDFSALSSAEKQAFMEGLDRSAVAFPTHYAATPQEVAQELELAALTAMERSCGWSLIGNLPWLVGLALELPLEELMTQPAATARRALEEHRTLHPFLAILSD